MRSSSAPRSTPKELEPRDETTTGLGRPPPILGCSGWEELRRWDPRASGRAPRDVVRTDRLSCWAGGGGARIGPLVQMAHEFQTIVGGLDADTWTQERFFGRVGAPRLGCEGEFEIALLQLPDRARTVRAVWIDKGPRPETQLTRELLLGHLDLDVQLLWVAASNAAMRPAVTSNSVASGEEVAGLVPADAPRIVAAAGDHVEGPAESELLHDRRGVVVPVNRAVVDRDHESLRAGTLSLCQRVGELVGGDGLPAIFSQGGQLLLE